MPRLAPLALALLLPACSATPIASLPALSRLDPATLEAGSLRAAVLMPATLRPLPGTARLVLKAGGQEVTLPLVTDPAAVAEAARDVPPPPGQHLMAFRIAPEALSALEGFRAAAIRDGARRMMLGVASEACRMADPGPGALPVSTLLRTRETITFVVLARFDLRRLLGPAALAGLPPCAPEAPPQQEEAHS
ncbi:hypothetical protein KTR66_18585 [Roseococcus sp. SDR]|uniref:hypothetical protein n=1 Tax=Roseococcus sp. SDR TaxID=2835532 RepID=UPI001BCD92FF|nr:hypothetical protein [Roseococcus sp. SDR]MBS7792014.1 hypothetical protein [Roseococcus sp. SDR]MBV1847328.1 hypothetical protein [Roseococcus sp. SDR]